MESYMGTSLWVPNKGTKSPGFLNPKLLVLQVGFLLLLEVVSHARGHEENTYILWFVHSRHVYGAL